MHNIVRIIQVMPSVATLEEMVARVEIAPGEIIGSIIARVSNSDRDVFLTGLSERAVFNPDDVPRWVCSWLVSALVANDARFQAADDEAEKLVACGKVGPGLTSTGLRARYNR
jgi:hypothetical protein